VETRVKNYHDWDKSKSQALKILVYG
jgi:hypothetical protein